MDRTDLEQLVERKVQEVVKSNNDDLLSSISGMINKISAKPTSSSLLEVPKFKRKSNEEQFKLNAKLFTKLEEVESAVDSNSIETAKECLIEAKDMIKRRQKLVKLADVSELGWRVVAEYETNPIASDSDDEKKIYRAEARASRKAKSNKGKKSRRFMPFRRQTDSAASTSQLPVQGQKQRPGLCFQCGKAGHWKSECTLQSTVHSNNKISIFSALEKQNAISSAEVDVSMPDKQSLGKENLAESGMSSESSCHNSPVGRLKRHSGKWREVSDNTYILGVVENGYKLPFKVVPDQVQLRNNKSARDNPEFVNSEIDGLLKKGVISEVADKPHVINPLTVAYNRGGKPRLVLDCRHINSCLHMFKVKFEDISIAERMFDLDSFVFTFDLKSAYHHIDIFKDHTTYLGFSWTKDGTDKYYVYNSLPFGIASAGHIFTKTLRVPVKYWRSLGHRVIMFLDDGIGGHVDYCNALSLSFLVKQSLGEFGFLLADDKCNWGPSKYSSWLGYVLSFEENRLFISEARISRLEATLQSILFQITADQLGLIAVRFLASVIGQIISLQSVIGKSVSLRTRYSYKCVASRASWNAPVKVSPEAVAELQYWLDHVRNLNNKGRKLKLQINTASISVFTDASAVGYGGYIVNDSHAGVICDTDTEVSEMTSWNDFDSCVSTRVEGKFGTLLPEVSLSDKNELPKVGRFGTVLPEVRLSDRNEPPEVGTFGTVLPEVRLLDKNNPPEVGHLALGETHTRKSALLTKPPEAGFSKGLVLSDPNPSGISNPRNAVKGSVVCGSWTEQEVDKSSTWRELEAVHRVLLTNINILRDKEIVLYSDNMNVSYILQSGSNKDELHSICLQIHDACLLANIYFTALWISRNKNGNADHLSRCLDSDDWSVSDDVFKYLNVRWGTHTIDRFASHYNAKCNRFNSRWWVPGTEAIDGLRQNWSGENNWIVPPPRCTVDCLYKLKIEKCVGTLVVPQWKSAPYWPELCDGSDTFKTYVKDVFVLPTTGAVVAGLGNNGMFAIEPFSFRMIALRCDCQMYEDI